MTNETPDKKPRRLPRGIVGYLEDRARNPDRYLASPDGLGPDFLFVENVARMLGCNVDFVRRIPRADLPASRRGQRLIYSRADVEAYVLAGRDTGAARYIPDRAPGKAGATVAPHEAAPVSYDPRAEVRKLLNLQGKESKK